MSSWTEPLAPLEQVLPLDMLEQNEASLWSKAVGHDPGHRKIGQASTTPHHEQSDVHAKDNFLTKRVRPLVHNRFFAPLNDSRPVVDAESMIHDDIQDEDTAYLNPVITSPNPMVWVPRDNAGVSAILIRGNEEKGVEEYRRSMLGSTRRARWNGIQIMQSKWTK